ncbi:MAG TPA: GtrA family protein [Micromonospora sp.]
MRLVRLLPDRWQKFVHEALKFGIVGGINTVINYAVFNALALTVFTDGQLKATVVATVVATITSYLMNRHWTYRDRPKSALRREYLLFVVFNATGLAIELGVLAIAKYGLGLTSLLALNVVKTAGLVIGTVFRFWAYRNFVFQSAQTPDELADAEMLAELDPVAELAEAVVELEHESTPGTGGSAGTLPRPAGGAARAVHLDRQVTPVGAEPVGRLDEAALPRTVGVVEPVLVSDLAGGLPGAGRRARR